MGPDLGSAISNALHFGIDPTLLRPARLAGLTGTRRRTRVDSQPISSTHLDLGAQAFRF